MLRRELMGNHDTNNGESTWLRLKLPGDAHSVLKAMARHEQRGFIDFAASILLDAAAGNFAIGEPPASDVRPIPDAYSIEKPSDQPLSAYAEGAQQLILLGTTLRSLSGFIETFLWPKAESGARLTFLLVSEQLFRDSPQLLEQVAFRHGRSPDQVYEQLRATTAKLEEIRREHPINVSVVKLPVLPTFGLTIVDPFKPSKKMRVSFYLYKHPSECNPALHIQPSTSESRHTFDLFMAHYVRLAEDAVRSSPLLPGAV